MDLSSKTRLHSFNFHLGLIILTLLMIAVGGGTRLNRSGLSITEWKPITGIIPPLSETSWNDEFKKYKNTPEFSQLNSHFTVSDYKKIYFWEYFHRLLGRLIFLYILVIGFFLYKSRALAFKVYLIEISLVAIQGLAGWIMVKSGLNNEPQVSPFLLATHYFLALALLAFAFYQLCKFRSLIYSANTRLNKSLELIIGASLCLQIFYGCLNSGFKAGYLSSTFPLINSQYIPDNLFTLSPWYTNFYINLLLVHWIHRWMGILTVILIFIFVFYNIRNTNKKHRGPFIHLLGISISQIFLGILLVTFHVPILIAIGHQLIAALIVLGFLNIIFRKNHLFNF